MDPQRAPAALCKNSEIAASLCCLDDAKGVLLPGNGQIFRVIASDLQKHAAVRSTLIGLTRRVKKTRTKAKNRGHFLLIADRVPHGLQGPFIVRVHRDRKSTRLNSSHVSISYAVFCLKKKKKSSPKTLP